jgi:hypothetical protein
MCCYFSVCRAIFVWLSDFPLAALFGFCCSSAFTSRAAASVSSFSVFWLSQKKCQGAAQRSASWPFLVLGSSDSVSCSQEHAAWHFFASVRGRAPACKGSWISECAKIFISSFRFPIRAGAALSLICVLLSLVVGAVFSCSIYERARPCGFSFPRCKPRAGGQSSFP